MTPTLAHPFDVDRYVHRIGYTGSRAATFDTLRAVHSRHVRTIPFENLDILLGRGIRIDVPSLEEKLVRNRRGGYCFEQNTLLAAALRAIGFTVTPLLARVRWKLPPGTATGLTHMLLRIETPDAGACLADVGFGSMSLVQPLRLEFDVEQCGGLEPRRLVQRGRFVVQQARLGEAWGDVYQFSLEEAGPTDIEIGNWFTATHPESRFVQNLVASRAGDRCRHTLLNREFTTRHADGRVDKRDIDSPDDLLALLATYFDLQFPPGTRFQKDGATWPA